MKNELNKQKSLYLKQHENNPVAWQAYSEETIARAKELNKPLFISIGYSSCHWCHVMAHESFENETAAEILNKYFVPVKIDREEFPNIDKRYQFYLHATGKRGGWPLSIFALPDGRPFFGGTYFPPKPTHGLPAFAEIVTQLGRLYQDTPKEAEKYSKNYDKFFDKFIDTDKTSEDLNDFDFHTASESFSKTFDSEYGGLGKDAKFPNIPVMEAMMEYYDTDLFVRDFMNLTADRLCTSGIYDHVNGGFYRYAVDRKWSVPHFEKMLYDNAQNTCFLLDMFEKTDNRLYLKIAEKTIDFILHEFNTDFGLISAMDADSLDDSMKLVEGFYYLVNEDQIRQAADIVTLTEGVITVNKADYEEYVRLEQHFAKIQADNHKEKPVKDTKIILSQNMLFLKALLRMFEVSGSEYYMEQASALLGKLRHFHMHGRSLFRINYYGEIMEQTTLEDYAFTIDAFMKFFDITKEKSFLTEASAFADEALKLFCKDGLIYLDTEKTVIDTFDDSIPNSISVFITLLLTAGDIMGIPVEKSIIDFGADRLIKYPGGHPTLFKTFMRYSNL
ncbi:MAG: thioredoxin domain-containing protein [Deferribacterales bacterium]